MKILHILNTSVPDIAGYTTRGYYLAKYQLQAGHQPCILTSERFPNESGVGKEVIDGVSYYRSKPGQRRITRIPVLAELDEIRVLSERIGEIAEAEGIEIVHAHSPSIMGAAAQAWCRKSGIPMVYEIRAFWEDASVDRGAITEGSLPYKMRRLHETKVVKNADAVVTICRGLRDDLLARDIPAEKVSIIRNGVDYDAFCPVEADLSCKKSLGLEGKTVVGFIGSFFHFEGVHLLLQAMAVIQKERSDIALLLVGQGQKYEEMRQLATELKVEQSVIFTGRVPHSEVGKYYSIIDVLAYPRLKKRITELVTPLKPLEAMAMAKAVVMSDVGGLAELVDDREFVGMFPAEDVPALTRELVALCDDPERRKEMGEKARRSMEANWSWASRAEQELALYSRLLSEK